MSRWDPGSRTRLVEAAYELFERQGFAQTAGPEIAAQAGVANRTFYRYFSDERDVVFDTDSGGAGEVLASGMLTGTRVSPGESRIREAPTNPRI